jgi:outer membrane protein TolC
MMQIFLPLYLAVVVWMSGHTAEAQPPDRLPSPLSLAAAIQYGLDNFPSIRAAVARVSGAKSGLDLARTVYLPRVDVGFQETRGTFNNVSGLYFSNPFTQPISGADLGRRSYSSAWGSSAGIAAAWEPFDFGLRAANVEAARAAEQQATAGVALTRLEVGLGVGDAFLALVAAQEAVRAMQANVERLRVFAERVGVLVKNELRPGVDASRARAELAFSRTQLIQVQQTEEIARATLAEVLGVAGERLAVQTEPLLKLPPSSQPPELKLRAHPLAAAQETKVEVFRKRKEALDLAWAPRFSLQAGFYGRGSGWDARGNRNSGTDGLLPDTPNWGAGLTATFSLFDLASIRAQRRIEQYNEAAESAKHDQVLQELTARQAKALATAESARRIAENTPVQLAAARETEAQARVRYQAGLTSVIEVAEAQRLLVQANIDDALARLGVWRSLLGVAASRGDLGQFRDLLKSSPAGEK